MSVRSILIPVRGDGKGENVLNAALIMAERYKAHLDVFHARMRPVDMVTFGAALSSGFMRDEVAEVAEQHAMNEEARVKALFEEYCQTHKLEVLDRPRASNGNVSASWHEERGRQADVVARRGRLTDIIFIPRPEGQLGARTFEAALMSTSRPVVIVPPNEVKTLGDHVAIAWNGSAEVAGAVTTSRTIVESAKSVSIFAAEEESEHGISAEDLAAYLRWHGCDPEIVNISCPGHEIGQNLLKQCADRNVDLLVMGGYGQMRRHELMMGGVTEHVVNNAELPVLFRH